MTSKTTLLSILVGCCALLLASCGTTEPAEPQTDGDQDSAEAEAGEASDSDEDAVPQCTPPLVPVGHGCEPVKRPELGAQWQRITPGGETSCARGTPFYFFVRGGKVNRLLVSFRGGGACWNASSCAVNEKDTFFADSIEEDHDPTLDKDGILDLANADNPFADWYMVHVPYCTGDLHWGSADVTYPAHYSSPEISVRHRGFTNASAVIDWIAERFNAPERLFITGGSAGAYGSELHSIRLMTLFPYAVAANLGDGGSGAFPRQFYLDSIPRWGFGEHISGLPGYGDRNYADTDYGDYRIALAKYFTGRTFASATTIADQTQDGYYLLTGGKAGAWSQEMLALTARVAEKADNYRFFLMPGSRHVTIYSSAFYTEEVNGLRYRDWVAKLAEGQSLESVRCPECK